MIKEIYAKSKVTSKNFMKRHSRLLISLLILFLVIYVFVPQLGNLKESIKALQSADKVLLLYAVIVFMTSFPILAVKYYSIVRFKMNLWLNLQVQIASAFISKLLPMSIGSLTVNTFYLTYVGKNVVDSASAMTLNAVTSSIAFGALIVYAIIAGNTSIMNALQSQNISWRQVVIIVFVIGLIGYGISQITKIQNAIITFTKHLWSSFKKYRHQPKKISLGILFNGLGSLSGIVTLLLCGRALGLPLTLSQSILTYGLGSILGNVVPTPGGLGGVEAGLYAGLVFFGYDADLALLTTLTYRFITYWLPLIPGYLMYRHLHHTVLANFHFKQKSNPQADRLQVDSGYAGSI